MTHPSSVARSSYSEEPKNTCCSFARMNSTWQFQAARSRMRVAVGGSSASTLLMVCEVRASGVEAGERRELLPASAVRQDEAVDAATHDHLAHLER